MLGQPVSMLIPRVVGFKLTGELPEGATATDLVLTITEMLRKHGVVGKFVEFYGDGVAAVPLANRATIGNMSPEYGSTVRDLPDRRRDARLPAPHRPRRRAARAGRGLRQGAGPVARPEPRAASTPSTSSSTSSTVVPSLAGPKRPQDRVAARREAFRKARSSSTTHGAGRGLTPPATRCDADGPAARQRRADCTEPVHAPTADESCRPRRRRDRGDHLVHEHLEPVGDDRRRAAGQEGRRAGPDPQAVGQDHARARARKVVTDYYEKAGLTPYLEKLGFNLVGYGCTTCIGNSGPLPDEVSAAVNETDLAVVVGALRQPQLRGPHQPRRQDELPRLAAAGRRLRARRHDGHRPRRPSRSAPDSDGNPVFLRDIWPSPTEIQTTIAAAIDAGDVHRRATPTSSPATSAGSDLPTPDGRHLRLGSDESTYVRKPPYFDGMPRRARPVTDIAGARVLAMLGDSVTTDHISPGRLDQGRQPRRAVPRRARRRPQGLQLLRLAARQPRGDDPRHVRQHPAAQPAARRTSRAASPATSPSPDAPQTSDLRRGAGLRGAGHAAGRPRRQGVRLGLVARLGGQGHRAAGRPGRHRRVLRAHPPRPT